MLASDAGHAGVVSLLLDAGANKGLRDNGRTAVILASRAGHVEVLSLLEEHP